MISNAVTLLIIATITSVAWDYRTTIKHWITGE